MEYWDGFDSSHWKTSDKAWMAERKHQWLEIEKLLYVLDKNKKARSIVKQYFLKASYPSGRNSMTGTQTPRRVIWICCSFCTCTLAVPMRCCALCVTSS